MKTTILIDGQNLYYQLRRFDVRESQINWSTFFSLLLSEEDTLTRAYWFRTEKVYAGKIDLDTLKKDISYQSHKKKFSDLNDPEKKQIKERASKKQEWFYEQQERFNKIQDVYKYISQKYDDIELVLVGYLKLNLKDEIKVGEKGVDVALASKMVQLSLENKTEKIIIVSGDYDYAYAINLVKNNMTKVHIVKLFTGKPPKNNNTSLNLGSIADKVISIYNKQIEECLLIDTKP